MATDMAVATAAAMWADRSTTAARVMAPAMVTGMARPRYGYGGCPGYGVPLVGGVINGVFGGYGPY